MLLRRRLAVLVAGVILAIIMAIPALATPGVNQGHKIDDGPDKNKGGGQEKLDHAHPPHAGGDQHGGGAATLVGPGGVELAKLGNNGNKGNDGPDKNLGGGQEHTRNSHPPHAGGDQHGGGLA